MKYCCNLSCFIIIDSIGQLCSTYQLQSLSITVTAFADQAQLHNWIQASSPTTATNLIRPLSPHCVGSYKMGHSPSSAYPFLDVAASILQPIFCCSSHSPDNCLHRTVLHIILPKYIWPSSVSLAFHFSFPY